MAVREAIKSLTFQGSTYLCRVLENPHPQTEPVVMIGGVYQDVYGWPRLERELTPITSMIIMDLPGSGAADRLPETYGFDFLEAALHHAIVALDIPRVNIVGMSLGYATVYRFAQCHPDRVARMALGGTTVHTTPGIRANFSHLVALLDAGEVEKFADLAVNCLMCQDSQRIVRNRVAAARLLRHVLAHTNEVERFAECSRRLLLHPLIAPGGIRHVPALVFTGEHDTFTEPDLGRGVAATIEGARFAAIKEADHMVPLERSRDFGDLLLRFFTDQPLETMDYLCGLVRPGQST